MKTAKTLATIRSARAHQGSEAWAIKTICAQSELDVDPAEVTILRHDKAGTSPTGMRYVMVGGSIIGSYSLELVGGDDDACGDAERGGI